MRNVLAAAAFMLSLSLVLPAAAATCPGTVVFQDLFKTPNPALDLSAYAASKIAIQAGKAEITFLQSGYSRNEEYVGTQYGDATVCATFNTLKTDKAETQVVGIIFWATDYSNFYALEVEPANGTMALAQLASSAWTFPIAWTANAAIVKTMGAANTLQVRTKGNAITLLINGLAVGSYTGTPPAGGGVVGFTVSPSNTSLSTLDVTDFVVAVP
jgi:hypothetical protein